jgi:transcriptional regulator with XRE-family HTH domain
VNFGDKLEAYLVRYCISKRLLAQRVGIHPDHLTDILKNRVNPPKANTVERIIGVLRLSSEEAADLREEAKKRVLYNKDNQPFVGKVHNTL